MKINFKSLIIVILIPLFVGWLSGFIASDSVEAFNSLIKPALSPPASIFPFAWTILYILMGISSYLILTSYGNQDDKMLALRAYAAQLFLNFFWSIIFFNLEMYGVAFIWLVMLWIAIVVTIKRAYPLTKLGAYLLVPYLLWVTFAGYLNLAIFLLN